MDICPRCKSKCELEYLGYYDNDAGIFKCSECEIIIPISVKYFDE